MYYAQIKPSKAGTHTPVYADHQIPDGTVRVPVLYYRIIRLRCAAPLLSRAVATLAVRVLFSLSMTQADLIQKYR
jgi:hypothetical protein